MFSCCSITLISYALFYPWYVTSTELTNELREEIELIRNISAAEGRLDINIVDLDANIAKVCARLKRLDKVLTKMYEDPPKNCGEEFMRLSRTYNQACLYLLYFCTLDKHKTLKAAQDIIEQETPKFLEVDIDEKLFEERFNWLEDDIESLHIVRKKTNEHWYDLYHMYKALPY